MIWTNVKVAFIVMVFKEMVFNETQTIPKSGATKTICQQIMGHMKNEYTKKTAKSSENSEYYNTEMTQISDLATLYDFV